MWASTLCPLLSSTRNIALGSASTTAPSISITPSFLAIASLRHCVAAGGNAAHDGSLVMRDVRGRGCPADGSADAQRARQAHDGRRTIIRDNATGREILPR